MTKRSRKGRWSNAPGPVKASSPSLPPERDARLEKFLVDEEARNRAAFKPAPAEEEFEVAAGADDSDGIPRDTEPPTRGAHWAAETESSGTENVAPGAVEAALRSDAPPDASAGVVPIDARSEVDDLGSPFFDAPIEELESVDHHANEPSIRPLSAATLLRRARFARYVKGAVGVCSALCLAAVVRGAVAHGQGTTEPTQRSVAAHVDAPEPTAAVPAEPEVANPPPEAPLPAASAAPVGSASRDPAGAHREARLAQVALEARRTADAIAAGKRATALDPTDGEGWLVLGAAYQEAGQLDDARRCYRACVTEGTRGPRGECTAMLR